MIWYRARLERDLVRWQEKGFVTEAGAASIRNDLATTKTGLGAAGAFAILGAVLFGFAVMSFVAANWEGMSKLARMVLLFVTMWACYGGAAYLFQRSLARFANAAVLGGIAIYGASIMLIAQMYHMEGNPPDAVLLWALGALLTAFLVRSPPALAATFVLLVVWNTYERSLSETLHLAFVPVWALAALAAWMLRWRPGLHLAALSLVIWITPIGYLVFDRHAHWLVVVIGLLIAGATSFGAREIDARTGPISSAVFVYGIATAVAGLFILQFIDERQLPPATEAKGLLILVLLAGLTLAVLLATMVWGIHTGNTGAMWLAYAAFAGEIFTLYAKTFGNLLNTSLFFLVAAMIVSGLAWLAYRLHHRTAAPKMEGMA